MIDDKFDSLTIFCNLFAVVPVVIVIILILAAICGAVLWRRWSQRRNQGMFICIWLVITGFSYEHVSLSVLERTENIS